MFCTEPVNLTWLTGADTRLVMSATADSLALRPSGVALLNSKVLILNRSYLPVHVTSVKRAFALLYQGVARAVDEQYRTFDFDSWRDLAIELHHERVAKVLASSIARRSC